jgi:hypothetical protein
MQRTVVKVAGGVVTPPNAKNFDILQVPVVPRSKILYVHKNCIVIGQHVISEENLFTFEYISSYNGCLVLQELRTGPSRAN